MADVIDYRKKTNEEDNTVIANEYYSAFVKWASYIFHSTNFRHSEL
jgi:hypothetical protein